MNLMLTKLMINCWGSTAVSLNGGEKQLVMSQRKNTLVAAAHKKLMPPKYDSAKSEIWSCLLVMTYGVKYETLVFVKCCDVSMKLTSDFCRLKKLFCGLSSFDIRPLSSNQFILESHARLKENPSRIQKLLDYLGSLKLEVFLFFFFNHSEHMVKSHCCFINMNKNHYYKYYWINSQIETCLHQQHQTRRGFTWFIILQRWVCHHAWVTYWSAYTPSPVLSLWHAHKHTHSFYPFQFLATGWWQHAGDRNHLTINSFPFPLQPSNWPLLNCSGLHFTLDSFYTQRKLRCWNASCQQLMSSVQYLTRQIFLKSKKHAQKIVSIIIQTMN